VSRSTNSGLDLTETGPSFGHAIGGLYSGFYGFLSNFFRDSIELYFYGGAIVLLPKTLESPTEHRGVDGFTPPRNRLRNPAPCIRRRQDVRINHYVMALCQLLEASDLSAKKIAKRRGRRYDSVTGRPGKIRRAAHDHTCVQGMGPSGNPSRR